jgi:hypothetical protein
MRALSPRLRSALILLLLFVAAWLPRVLALDSFVSTDERKWLARSGNFLQAISHGDLANTFQREHPGVTVMAAGALGFLQKMPDYPALAPGQFTWEAEHIEAWLAENGAISPLEMLTAGRWWIVLGVALIIALGFLPLRRLFGQGPAILATLFVAWDPLAIGFARQLHPDGFVAGFTYLALLLFLAWLYTGRRRSDLIASGFVMGLAWLTKTPAIFLVPTGALLIVIEIVRTRRSTEGSHWQPVLGGYVVWGAIATLTFVTLWPSMWVHPIDTLTRMAVEMSDYVERHTNINFFLGQPVADPGPFFYPVAWLFRTTPAVIAGLAAAAFFGGRKRQIFAPPLVRRAAMALLLFALVFVLGMTMGAKKFDRYILPAFLALDVVAALGWWAAGQAVAQWRGATGARVIQWTVGVAVAGLLALHALFAALHFPYYITYFNPLTGGSATAPQTLFVGWGEGLDEAAAWLNQQPDAENLRVAAWYNDGPFSYYFKGQNTNLGSGSPLGWLDTDYAVTYINQWQRQIPSPEAVAWFGAQTPVHSVSFRGLDLAYIYDLRGLPLPAFIDIPKENAADFGEQIRLLAYTVNPVQVQPGSAAQVTLYEQARAAMTQNYNVLLRLVGPEETGGAVGTGSAEIWRSEGWPWGAPTADWPLRQVRPDGHTVVPPAHTPPGLYKLLLSFYDPATFATLPAVTLDGASLGDVLPVAMLQVGDGPPVAGVQWRFGQLLALDGVALAAEPAVGEPLQITLNWESLARTATPYTLFTHLVGPDGAQVAGVDGPPLGGFAATNLLLPGQRFADALSVMLPADAPSGAYRVQMGLYDAATGARLPLTGAGQSGDAAPVLEFVLP